MPDPERPQGSGLKILMSDQLSIEVDDHFSPDTLMRLLTVLEAR
jgi:hypothetical protein